MATRQLAVGVDHPTVVPANLDPDELPGSNDTAMGATPDDGD